MSQRNKPPRRRLTDEQLEGNRWIWRLGGLTPRELLFRVFGDSRTDRIFGTAAEMSFYFLLGFFPLVIFASALAGFIFESNQELSDNLLEYLEPTMPQAAYQLTKNILDQVVERSFNAGAMMWFFVAIWSASYGMEAVIRGMNVAFDVTESRSWWKRRLLAILMTLMSGVTILFALLSVILGKRTTSWIAAAIGIDPPSGIWALVQWGILLLILFATISLVYVHAPNLRYQPWTATLPGTAAALIVWLGATFLFRAYLNRFFDSYETIYGSLGAGVAVILWLYITAGALLIGAEVNSEIRWAASNSGSEEARAALEDNRD